MNEEDIVEVLLDSMAHVVGNGWQFLSDDQHEVLQGTSTRTFEEAMLLTHDKGFIMYLKDGSEFQVTVIRRR